MKRLSITFYLLGITFITFSQDIPKIYFDKNWNPSNENQFSFYRIIDSSKDTLIVLDYYKNGNIQCEAVCNKNDTLLDSLKNQGNIPNRFMEIVNYYDKRGRIINTIIYNPKKSKELLPELINDSLKTGKYEIDSLTYEKYYRKNGEISWESFTKDYTNQGLYLEYYGNKGNYQLAAIANYHNNLLNGTVVNLYPDGTLMRTTEYVNGVKEGDCIHYDGNNNIVWKKIYQNGHPIKKTFPAH